MNEPERILNGKYIDITHLINEDRKLFPIPVGLIYSVGREKFTHDSVIICKICNYAIRYCNANYEDGKDAPRFIANNVELLFSHLAYHRFKHAVSDSDRIKEGYCMTFPNEIVGIIHENTARITTTSLTTLFKQFQQLLLIIRTDTEFNITKFHRQLWDKHSPFELIKEVSGKHNRTRSTHDIKNYCREEMIRDYAIILMKWDFKCIFCDREYESGLPAIEVVIEHVKDCLK